MTRHPDFHNVDDSSDAIVRQLATGLTAHIYPGDQAMISVVSVAPGASGSLHHHPEEQWGLCLEGSGIRVQGDQEIPLPKAISGAPPVACPTQCARALMAVVCWTFAPPRDEYRRPGSGFGAG